MSRRGWARRLDLEVREAAAVLRDAGRHWWADNTFQMGAALAYYTVFSLAPIILIALAIASLVFEPGVARRQMLQEINNTVGPQVGQAIDVTAQVARQDGNGPLAAVLSGAVLAFGATSVFAQLQESLNTIWGVRARPGRGFWGVLRDRFWSFTVVIGIGFLLLVSLLVSTVLAAVADYLTPASHPGGLVLWQALHGLSSYLLITLLFALLYKILPDVRVGWGDVWLGAAATALLFSVGKWAIGLYLGKSATVSSYGAAGSLVVVLLWVYYSSQIFLFGAELIQARVARAGQRVKADPIAEPLTPEARARQGMDPHVPAPEPPVEAQAP